MYGGGFDGLKNFLPKQLLESNCRGWVSDVEVRILEYLSNFRFVEPKMLVQGGFCRNGKVAYVYVKLSILFCRFVSSMPLLCDGDYCTFNSIL